ncbi:MAG: hypothetical protein U0414_41670 [Polyangiaceae bacterium]
MTSPIRPRPLVVSDKRRAVLHAKVDLIEAVTNGTRTAPEPPARAVAPPRNPAVVRPAAERLASARARTLADPPDGFYLELQRLLDERRAIPGDPSAGQSPPDEPDIDATSVREIAPGRPLVLYGTDLGGSASDDSVGAAAGASARSSTNLAGGRIVYEPSLGGPTYDLVIDAWSTTEIKAHLDEALSGVGPASDGELWVIRADGRSSNRVRVDLEPALVEYGVLYMADFVRPIPLGALKTNGVAGRSEEELPWGFTILRATLRHAGAGTSSLEGPTAGGRTWAQGYEVTMPPGNAQISIEYRVRGPRGVAPPPLVDPRFSDWFAFPDA